MEFRNLRADEIEVRVGTVTKTGATLLFYKDARCDQNILDETVGAMNWQRHHNRDNANCIVAIWDETKKQWIEKEDTGTESYTEKEKGLASDSFKRACVNWGIGRELYTAPKVRIRCRTKEKENGKGYELVNQFEFYGAYVSAVEYDGHRMCAVTVCDSDGAIIYDWRDVGSFEPSKVDKIAKLTFAELCKAKGQDPTDVLRQVGWQDGEEMTNEQHGKALRILKGLSEKEVGNTND